MGGQTKFVWLRMQTEECVAPMVLEDVMASMASNGSFDGVDGVDGGGFDGVDGGPDGFGGVDGWLRWWWTGVFDTEGVPSSEDDRHSGSLLSV